MSDPRERFDVEIVSDKLSVSAKGLGHEEALALVEGTVKNNQYDPFIRAEGERILSMFGFYSVSTGKQRFGVRGYIPRIETGEVQTCGRRMQDFGPWERKEGLDSWEMIGDDRVCSFCGSLHPERVIELIKERGVGIVERSTKGYKLYIHRPEVRNASYGGIKYYRQHDTEKFKEEFAKLMR